jgi:hypothetical protein
MNKSIFTLLSCLLVSVFADAAQASENTAINAIKAIPSEYADAIVMVSCKGANPDPQYWLVMAYQDEVGDGPKEFRVIDGQVSDEHENFKIGALVAHSTLIDTTLVKIDSPQVLAIAQQACQDAGREMSAGDASLTQDGGGAAPVWSVTCYDSSGKTIGSVRISAVDGSIFSKNLR